MINTHLIYQAYLKSDKNEDIDGKIKEEKWQTPAKCCFCGGNTYPVTDLKHAVSGNFTQWDIFAPGGKICQACFFCFANRQLVFSSFIATRDKLNFLKKDEIEGILFDLKNIIPEHNPFVFAVTESYKKHTAPFTSMNTNTLDFVVRFENINIQVKSHHKTLYQLMRRLYDNFTKNEIETGDFDFKRAKNYGLERLQNDNDWLTVHRGTPIFKFILYVMNPPVKSEQIDKNQQKEKKDGNNGKRGKRKTKAGSGDDTLFGMA